MKVWEMEKRIVFLWVFLCLWMNMINPFYHCHRSFLSCKASVSCHSGLVGHFILLCQCPLSLCVLFSFSLRQDEVRVGSKALCQLSGTLVWEPQWKLLSLLASSKLLEITSNVLAAKINVLNSLSWPTCRARVNCLGVLVQKCTFLTNPN